VPGQQVLSQICSVIVLSELNIAELDENADKAQKLNNVNNEEVFRPRPKQREKSSRKSKQPI
jgi:hypothetical protein